MALALFLLLNGLAGMARAAGPKYAFALYLIRKDDPGLDRAELETEPLFTGRDVITYDWARHTLKLKRDALRKIPRSDTVGVHGLPFMIVVDGKRCYRGAWWTSLSSFATEEPVIDVLAQRHGELRIDRGYPPSEFHPGSDPRADLRIRRALLRIHKLKN